MDKLYYGEKEFIKAHQNLANPFYNHSYDREVRYALCQKCKAQIGIQSKYVMQTEFNFGCDKDNYKYCPYCGHKFKKK